MGVRAGLVEVGFAGGVTAGLSGALMARTTPSKRSLQALSVRPRVSTPLVARLTIVKKPVISQGKFQRRRSIGGRYSGRSRSIRPPRRPVHIVAGV